MMPQLATMSTSLALSLGELLELKLEPKAAVEVAPPAAATAASADATSIDLVLRDDQQQADIQKIKYYNKKFNIKKQGRLDQ